MAFNCRELPLFDLLVLMVFEIWWFVWVKKNRAFTNNMVRKQELTYNRGAHKAYYVK